MVKVVSNTIQAYKDRRGSTTIFLAEAASIAVLIVGLGLGARWLNKNYFRVAEPIPTEESVSKTTNTAEPARLSLPTVGIEAPIIRIGKNPDNTLEVPAVENEVGWYIYGSKPGDTGPAVLVGHKDSVRGRAIFADLHNIKEGDPIMIKRADGSTLTYRVESKQTYSQDAFPTENVYGPTDYASLRLITCAGVYSRDILRYSDNLVVYARLE